MRKTITIRLRDDLDDWPTSVSKEDGACQGANRSRGTGKSHEPGGSTVYATCRLDAGPEGSLEAEGVLAVVNGIAGTSFIVAAANRPDCRHSWAEEIARKVREPILTCEALLARAAFPLRSSRLFLKA